MAATETKEIIQASDIVTYLVKVEDKEIEKKFQVVSITVETGINKIPRANIVISDGSVAEKKLESDELETFHPGKKIEIQLGYRKKNKTENNIVFNGMIVTNNHKFNDYTSELIIDCKHEAEIMTFTNANNCPLPNSSDSEIIINILEKNHITDFHVDETTIKQPQLIQANKTDWDFIMSRIDVAGMICVFPETKLSIITLPKPKTNEAGKEDLPPTHKFTHGINILEFNAELDSRVEPSIVKVLSWDYTTQTIKETASEEETVADDPNKKEIPQKLKYEYIITTPTKQVEESQQGITNAKKSRQDLSKIKGTIKFLGHVQVKPGDFIKISGVGKKFEGEIFVSNILHEFIDGCWITTATLGWEEKFFAEQRNSEHPSSAIGQSSSMQGLHVGKVTGIEDKEGNYRVQVKLPMVDDKSDGVFARVATLDAGKNRGTFFMPEIDDEVVLGFMADDPSNPVILGMLHSSALPAPLEPEKNNHQKGYVSRTGVKWIIHDDDKSLLLQTPGKRFIELHDKNGTITLEDDFGNKVIMEKSGITIESAGDIIMKAKKAFKVSAGTSLELKANSSATVEGTGPVSIKSNANTEIKGLMVMIN